MQKEPCQKCVLFDLDGVVYDSRDAYVMAVRYALDGILESPPPRELALKYYWAGDPDAIKFVARDMGANIGDVSPLLEKYRASFKNEFLPKYGKLCEGVIEVIGKLRKSGFAIGVVTNNSSTITKRAFEIFGLDGLFDAVVTLSDVKQGKPSPEPVLKALSLLGCGTPEKCFFVGDSRTDFLAGTEAGVNSIIYQPNGRFPEGIDGAIRIMSLFDLLEISK